MSGYKKLLKTLFGVVAYPPGRVESSKLISGS
jgi:hypothetical protein